jgi:hypothetical protein
VGDENSKQGDFHIVLANGGIYTPPEFEEDDEQNAEIVRMFFERTPETRIIVEAKTGVRDMVEYNADFVEKIFSKRLNMEYDWKRAPFAVTESKTYGHIAFSTRPWVKREQFVTIRDNWNEYVKNDPHCLKTLDDFDEFSSFVESRTFLEAQTANPIHHLYVWNYWMRLVGSHCGKCWIPRHLFRALGSKSPTIERHPHCANSRSATLLVQHGLN